MQWNIESTPQRWRRAAAGRDWDAELLPGEEQDAGIRSSSVGRLVLDVFGDKAPKEREQWGQSLYQRKDAGVGAARQEGQRGDLWDGGSEVRRRRSQMIKLDGSRWLAVATLRGNPNILTENWMFFWLFSTKHNCNFLLFYLEVGQKIGWKGLGVSLPSVTSQNSHILIITLLFKDEQENQVTLHWQSVILKTHEIMEQPWNLLFTLQQHGGKTQLLWLGLDLNKICSKPSDERER